MKGMVGHKAGALLCAWASVSADNSIAASTFFAMRESNTGEPVKNMCTLQMNKAST